MLEKDLIQTRGFHNIKKYGKTIGFQFCIRLTYYRGIYLSQLRPQKVIVDGKTYSADQVVWEIKGKKNTPAKKWKQKAMYSGARMKQPL